MVRFIISRSKSKRNFIHFSIFSVIIIDTIRYLSFNQVKFSYGNTIIAFLAYISIVFILSMLIEKKYRKQRSGLNILFKIWLFYASFGVIRGLFEANNYYDYRFLFLFACPYIFVCMFFYLGQNIDFAKKLIFTYLKKYIILIFIIGFLTYTFSKPAFSRLVIPCSLLLVFTPYFKKNWLLIIFSIMVISIISNPSFRTNIIKSVLSILILSGYYFKLYNSFLLKIIFVSGIALPLILLWFGLFGGFNIFQSFVETETIEVRSTNNELQEQNTDTRTFLYNEVITDVIKNKSLLFGKSPSQGYNSPYFKERVKGSGGYHNGKRYRCEVNFLNILLYYGLFGVVLYVLVLLRIAYLGLFKSNNILAKMLGLIFITRYVLSFLEEHTQYDTNFLFFWLIAGFVSSKAFRELSDNQLKLWFSGKIKLIELKYK